MRFILLLSALFFIILSAGCRTVMVVPATTHTTVTHTRVVVPPHAPAHGYRDHYRGYDLEYDSGIGAYIVLGYDDIYFYNNIFVRYYGDYWQVAEQFQGPWRRDDRHFVPDRLRKHRRHKNHARRAPLPHAPAHGYRHHHDHVDLEFDSNLDAYLVLGYDGLFFFDNLYIRFYGDHWQVADRIDGTWRSANERYIPEKLRKHRRHNKYREEQRYSPPPIRAKHGYRHHHHDTDLQYDSKIGAYLVLGHDGFYFYDNRYIRYNKNRWQTADRLNGTWRNANEKQIPGNLQKYRRPKERSNKNGGLLNRMKEEHKSKLRENQDIRKKETIRERHEERGRNDSRERHDDRDSRKPYEKQDDRKKYSDRDKIKKRDRDEDRKNNEGDDQKDHRDSTRNDDSDNDRNKSGRWSDFVNGR